MSDAPKGLMDFVKDAKSRITEVDGDQLESMKQERPDLMILDVRESSEHETAHIEEAMLIPRGILEAAADAGATHAGYVLVRLPHGVEELFVTWLEHLENCIHCSKST